MSFSDQTVLVLTTLIMFPFLFVEWRIMFRVDEECQLNF
jgi:hypothetical protein